MTDVVAPVQSEWWDLESTLTNVLRMLRLAGGDIDEDRITALIPTAGYQINSRLDLTIGIVPGSAEALSLQDALESLTIALYQPPVQDIDGSFMDPVDMVAGQITPQRERWGVA